MVRKLTSCCLTVQFFTGPTRGFRRAGRRNCSDGRARMRVLRRTSHARWLLRLETWGLSKVQTRRLVCEG